MGQSERMESNEQESTYSPYSLAGLLIGPLLAGGFLLMPAPEGLSAQGWAVAAVGVWMAVWWMTEAMPLAATAMLPLVLFPLLGIQPIKGAAASYAHPLIFLFLGGFLLARTMSVWGLDRRLALVMLRHAGSNPRAIIGALMAATAFLSMWVSNTATTMVMLPIAVSIAGTFAASTDDGADNPAAAMLLGIAYAATIGGMGTIIGTPPNALFAAFMSETYGIEISFYRWMLIGVPLVLICAPIAWFVLTRVTFKISPKASLETPDVIIERLKELGPISRPERVLALIMTCVALAWVTRPWLASALPELQLSDAGIAMTGVLLVFLIPVDLIKGRFMLSWKEATSIRWDVLILFGGGLALAGAASNSDLSAWIGTQLSGLAGLPIILLLLSVGVVIVLVGELASNTAMAAVFLPIAGATAIGIGQPPIFLALPVALFATLGFMLPVATPPNAIIFGSGRVEMRDMIRAGVILNVVGILVVASIVLLIGDVLIP